MTWFYKNLYDSHNCCQPGYYSWRADAYKQILVKLILIWFGNELLWIYWSILCQKMIYKSPIWIIEILLAFLIVVRQYRSYQIGIEIHVTALGAYFHLSGPRRRSLPWGQKNPREIAINVHMWKILDVSYIYIFIVGLSVWSRYDSLTDYLLFYIYVLIFHLIL